jgi:uncharacterized membrane protein HdeD (DUF308 family)
MTDAGVPVPPPPRPIELRDADAGSGDWLISILVGVALVAVGVWLLANLYESVTVPAVLVGISFIVGGVAEAVALGGTGALGPIAWVSGGLLVVTGIVVLAWPDATLWTIAVLAGIGLLVAGLVRVGEALTHRDRPDWPGLAVGALGVVIGALVLAWPGATLVVLAIVLGLRAIGTGLVAIGVGWQLHRLA